ncbi:MAG: hypothetical protein BA870_01355 [Desulfuromonadales bacterium C00003094]|jgi:predicted metal-dependent hydrolase|nr:MAG: hypothetical protein BA870_01355 [Desulfuromonadales bacterium C00003094]
MPVLTIGNTNILYQIRRSDKAKRRRIVVTPGKVEVVIPAEMDQAAATDFVQLKRRWIFEKWLEIKEQARHRDQQGPSRFVTGAKFPYRGRQMRLTVNSSKGHKVEVSYRNGFTLAVPTTLAAGERDNAIQAALEAWLIDRMQRDVEAFVNQHGTTLDVKPKRVQIKGQKHLWGSCGRDHIINLNWHLIFAPKPVLEYAVVHELCHLRHRDHSEAFWQLLGQLLPDYLIRKRWLETHESLISPTFLPQ